MLKELPRARLANLPTPLHIAEHLSKTLGGAKIIFKRDDATGPALGGQKARMLEYVFGDAMASKCDVIVDIGMWKGTLSPHIAAAANVLDLDHITICLKPNNEELTGMGFLFNLMDPNVIQTPWVYPETLERAEQKKKEVIENLKLKGRQPYEIGLFSKPLGLIGYFYAIREIMDQLQEMGETADYLYVAHATGTTHGGLVLGAKHYKAPFKIVGTLTIPGLDKADRVSETLKAMNAATELLGADMEIHSRDLIVRDEYLGKYGVTEEAAEAIYLVAKTEGILLDPHYTGRTMAALIEDIRRKNLTSSDTVVFYHSGGAAMLYSYIDQLKKETRGDLSILYQDKE